MHADTRRTSFNTPTSLYMCSRRAPARNVAHRARGWIVDEINAVLQSRPRRALGSR